MGAIPYFCRPSRPSPWTPLEFVSPNQEPMVYISGGQTFLLADKYSTDKQHCQPQQNFFSFFLSQVNPKNTSFYGDFIQNMNLNQVVYHYNFATGAANNLRRASVWPHPVYIIIKNYLNFFTLKSYIQKSQKVLDVEMQH